MLLEDLRESCLRNYDDEEVYIRVSLPENVYKTLTEKQSEGIDD